MTLPPGQHAVDGFPRFGTHFHMPAPAIPVDPVIEVEGAISCPMSIPFAELAALPREELIGDLHCVSGWSATNLRWEGVAFKTLWSELIEPRLESRAPVTHVVAGGLDGYRAIVLLEDMMVDDVLIADRLDGRPVDSDHGAPLRLVSPSQYGYISVKHLCRIELYTSPPAARYHRIPALQIALKLVSPHPRGRVWLEERHRHLPPRLLRPIYRRLIAPIGALSARCSRRSGG